MTQREREIVKVRRQEDRDKIKKTKMTSPISSSIEKNHELKRHAVQYSYAGVSIYMKPSLKTYTPNIFCHIFVSLEIEDTTQAHAGPINLEAAAARFCKLTVQSRRLGAARPL